MELRDYVSSKLGAVKWLSMNSQDPNAGRYWITGTYDHRENLIAAWTMVKEDENKDELSTFSQLKWIKIGPAVRSFADIEKNIFAASFDDNGFGVFRFSPEKGILMSNFVNAGDKIGDHDSTGIMMRSHEELVSCGHDGRLVFVNLQNNQIRSSEVLDTSSILCIDQLSPHEIIFGTRFGLMRVFDTRTSKCEMKINAVQYGSTTALQRNPHIPHYIATGTDSGTLYAWDLRNTENCQIGQLVSHTATLNQIQYSPNEPNLLYTSSFDGKLCKWDVGNNFKLKTISTVVDRSGALPINSFDLNADNEIVAACDFELYFVS